MTSTRTIETVDELRQQVGQELGVGAWLTVTQEKIDAFADLSGDHQFIHVDPARAASTPFGTTIAHGMLTLSLLPSLREDWEGARVDLHPKMGINYGLNRVRFITPVRVGKRIRLRSKLLALEEVGENIWQTIYQQTVEIEDEPRPAMVAETITRHYL